MRFFLIDIQLRFSYIQLLPKRVLGKLTFYKFIVHYERFYHCKIEKEGKSYAEEKQNKALVLKGDQSEQEIRIIF